MANKYDIFISYRRDGGFEAAQLIAQHLKHKGYSVFFDLENLREGKFNVQLLEVIRKCKDFIVVLPPKALERCDDADDWVRQELVCAIQSDKNIIPVLLRGFTFPEKLPEEIKEVKLYNGVAAGDYNYLDASLQKIQGFLKSKRSITWDRYKKFILSALGIVLTGMIAFAIVWRSEQKEYQSLCKDISSAMGNPITMINGVVGEIDDLEKDWTQYTGSLKRISAPKDTVKPYNEFIERINYYKTKDRIIPDKKTLTERERKLLRKNGVEVEDIEGFFNIAIPAFYDELDKTLNALYFYASPSNYAVNHESSDHFADLDIKTIHLSAESLYLYYLGVMSAMPQKAVSEILPQITKNLLNLPQIDTDKPTQYYMDRSERINNQLNELVLKSENVVRREQEVVNRVETFLEDAKRSQEIKKSLERIEEKRADVTLKQAELSEAEKKLAEAYDRALQKFTIQEQDDQWYQWGKMLRIATLANIALVKRTEADKQYKEQVNIVKSQNIDPSFLTPPSYTYSLDDLFGNVEKWLDQYLKFHPDGSVYTASAKQFYKAVQQGTVPYTGVMVVGTKDDEPHPVFQTGDIILERKGKVIRNVEQYGSLASDPAENKVKILRFSSDGKPQYTSQTIPADCKVLVAMIDLTENE